MASIFATIAFLLALAAAPALGQGLPGVTTATNCVVADNGHTSNLGDPVACTLGGATSALTLSPVAGATAHADYAGGINTLVQASADVIYYFEVVGGNANDVVPLLIATELFSNASTTDTGAFASASLFVHGSAMREDQQVIVCTNGSCGTSATSFSGTVATRALSGATDNFIHLGVEAGVGDSVGAQFANASADPWIYVDPSFANASMYSIVVSEGVANAIPAVSAVPEPSIADLIAAALAVLLCSAAWQARQRGIRRCGAARAA